MYDQCAHSMIKKCNCVISPMCNPLGLRRIYVLVLVGGFGPNGPLWLIILPVNCDREELRKEPVYLSLVWVLGRVPWCED